jgi:hypothetical protein
MSNGIWSASENAEKLQQSDLVRHRLLVVSTGSNIALPWPADAASGFASLDPNTIGPGTHNPSSDRGPEGGPHFVMSGETPDESHTYGFEFCLMNTSNFLSTPALPGVGGYTVTIWVLISNTQDPYGADTPEWAAMLTQTGVNARELWHSFDVNAEAVRFQIANLANDPTVNNESIAIAFAEL